MYTFDDIYETLLGLRTEEGAVPGVEEARGLELAGEEVYRLRLRLEERLESPDDPELGALLDLLEVLRRETGRRCFQLGQERK